MSGASWFIEVGERLMRYKYKQRGSKWKMN